MRNKALQSIILIVFLALPTLQSYADYGPNGEGQLLWHYKPEGSDTFDWCQPAIIYNKASGKRTIIYGEGDEVGGGRLYAVDADTHKAVWGPIDFPGPIGNSPATLSSDGKRVYFGEGSKPGKAYCVDTANGHIIWTASGMPKDAGAFMASAALSHDDATVYMGSGAWPEDKTLSDYRLYAIDTKTGKLKWIFKSQSHPEERERESGAANYGSFFCDPAILCDGRIIAATFSGHVYCLKDLGGSAEMLWDFEHIDKNATGWIGTKKYHQEIWGSPAIDSDGTIYIGSNSGKVHAIDSQTGKQIWETEPTGGEVFGAPVIGSDGNVYAGAESHYLYVWKPPAEPTNKPIKPISSYFWKDRWPNGATALANGEVVFGGEQGNRYISVKLVEGQLLKKWESDPVGTLDETEAKTEPLIDPLTHTIYVSGGHSGGLFALKGSQPMADSPWPKVQRDIHNSGRTDSDIQLKNFVEYQTATKKEITSRNMEAELQVIETEGSSQPWSYLKMNNEQSNFQFVIVSDRTGAHREGVFEQGIEKVNLLQPEFVVCVGDLIEGYTEDIKQIRKEWAEFDKITAQLNMPFFFVPGNHDVGGKELVEIWKEKFGVTYYHFVYRNVLFLCLNSEGDEIDEDAPPISKKQVEYVKETLKAHPDVRWTLVFMHRPIWQYEKRLGAEMGKKAISQSGWGPIESMLKHRKHTVFAGHIHSYDHQTRHNQDYITLATTGGGTDFSDPFLEFDHVLWVTMTDDGPILANLMLEGIWDKDFTRQDVQKHLSLVTSGKAVRIESEYDDKSLSTSQPVTIRLSNSQDIPMEITLSFEKNEYVHFTPENIFKTIPPNSVERLTVQLHIDKLERSKFIEEEMEEEEGALAKVWDELWYLHLRWSINYDYDKYGKINLTGSRELF